MLGIAVAQSVDLRSFGVYGLVFVTYQLLLEASRALVSLPLQIRFSAAHGADWREGTRSASGAGAVLGLVLGGGVVGVGFLCDDPLRSGLIALGVTLPGLLIQDVWRFAFITCGRAVDAFRSDLAWVVAFAGALVVLFLFDAATVGWLIFAWGVAGCLGALPAMVEAPPPAFMSVRSWWREHRDLGTRYLFELLVSAADMHVVVYLMGAMAGLAAAGDFRGADLLLSPFNVLFFAASLMFVSEGVRLLETRQRPARDLWRLCVTVSVVLGLVAGLLGLIVLLLPDRLGTLVLGDVWFTAKPVVGGLAIRLVALGAFLGALIGLRTLAAATRSLRARIILSLVAFPLGVAGIALDEARGAAYGLAVAWWIGVAVTWRELRAELRSREGQ
jgi:hypothetical protein